MKKYSVVYNTTTSYEAVVYASTKKEAIAKVREVIGDPVTIEEAREMRNAE